MTWFERNQKWIVRFGLWSWLVFAFAGMIVIFEGIRNAIVFLIFMGLFASAMMLLMMLMVLAFRGERG